MLTLKQSPIALIGIFFTCSLADGEPEYGKTYNSAHCACIDNFICAYLHIYKPKEI